MYEFRAKQSKSQKTNWSNVACLFLPSLLQSFKLYLGACSLQDRKRKTQAQRRGHGRTFGKEANALTHQRKRWSMMNDLWARVVALH